MPDLRLAVVYIGDANYHNMMLYSLASVARSHSRPLTFHLMQSGYDAVVPPALERFVASRGHRLTAGRVDFGRPKTASRADAATYHYISDTMFLKPAAIDALVDHYDYILYLDGDTLGFADLDLNRIAGFKEAVGACIDQTAVESSDTAFQENIRSQTEAAHTIFNSGVLLVNCLQWRRQKVGARFLECLRQHDDACPYFITCEPNDQCTLNMAVAGSIHVLDARLNVQKVALHTSLWSLATLRHYTGPAKFLPIRLHRCDPREYALLCAIAREAGLEHPGNTYDYGVGYWLNGIRRRNAVRKVDCALAQASARAGLSGDRVGCVPSYLATKASFLDTHSLPKAGHGSSLDVD